jgi:hypothetical protein
VKQKVRHETDGHGRTRGSMRSATSARAGSPAQKLNRGSPKDDLSFIFRSPQD